jgi:hypothetical protein
MKKATVKSHTRSVKGKGNSTVKRHSRFVPKDASVSGLFKKKISKKVPMAGAPAGGVNKENLAMRKKDGQASRSKVGPQMVMKGNPVPKTSKKGGEGKSKKARGV